MTTNLKEWRVVTRTFTAFGNGEYVDWFEAESAGQALAMAKAMAEECGLPSNAQFTVEEASQ